MSDEKRETSSKLSDEKKETRTRRFSPLLRTSPVLTILRPPTSHLLRPYCAPSATLSLLSLSTYNQ